MFHTVPLQMTPGFLQRKVSAVVTQKNNVFHIKFSVHESSLLLLTPNSVNAAVVHLSTHPPSDR